MKGIISQTFPTLWITGKPISLWLDTTPTTSYPSLSADIVTEVLVVGSWKRAFRYEGLRNEQIPIEARIVSVADVFDALTHDRPYKKAWVDQSALAEIMSQSCKQFDPEVVNAFVIIKSIGLI